MALTYFMTFLPQTCTQVHVVLLEIESEPLVDDDDEVDSSDDYEDFLDTDPEDEWSTSDLPLGKV